MSSPRAPGATVAHECIVIIYLAYHNCASGDSQCIRGLPWILVPVVWSWTSHEMSSWASKSSCPDPTFQISCRDITVCLTTVMYVCNLRETIQRYLSSLDQLLPLYNVDY